jgi:CheY-like chemotaxis protein
LRAAGKLRVAKPSTGFGWKMSVKHALVVDDSVTARKVMSMQLQEQGLEVDTVESAGEAIDYLCDSSPDVIFMDYEMPGMDGFQALKAIKSNPETAMIPVLMYTSKEGGLHLGQARALGAVGVLPKTLEPVALHKILSEMHLLPGQEPPVRPQMEPETVRKEVEEPTETEDSIQDAASELQATFDKVEQSLQEQPQVSGDQLQKSIRDLSRKMDEELEINRELLLARMDERNGWVWPVAGLFVFMLVLLLGLLVIGIRVGDVRQMLAEQPTPVTNVVEEVSGDSGMQDSNTIAAQTAGNPVPIASVQWLLNQNSHFGYGQIPFSDSRIEWLNSLLSQLVRMGYRGEVLLRAHWGRFCEQERAQQENILPASDVSLGQCIISESSDVPVVYPSVGFSNLVDTHPAVESGRVSVSLENAGYESRDIYYPVPERVANAGEWNEIAAANQFIEVLLNGEFTTP